MKLICAWLIATLVPASAIAGPLTVSGVGTNSCGQWIAEHESPTRATVRGALMNDWVWGFVTSVNQFSPHSNNANIQGGTDDTALVAWVTSYCGTHPLDPLVTAAARLVLALRTRAHDDEPGQQ